MVDRESMVNIGWDGISDEMLDGCNSCLGRSYEHGRRPFSTLVGGLDLHSRPPPHGGTLDGLDGVTVVRTEVPGRPGGACLARPAD